MKIRLAVLALVLIAAGADHAYAQDLDSLRSEAVRSRGFIRGAETQLTKVLDLIDRIEVHPDGTVDTIYASDLVPDEAPPEWRVEEPAADSLSPPWVGDGRQLYTYWAWGDSSVVWLPDGGPLQVTMPRDRYVYHLWPVFQRGSTLWLPSSNGWRPATVHPSRPWVCIDPDSEAEEFSFTEKIVVSGMKLGLKVAEWTIGIDSTFAQGLDRLPPDCPPMPDQFSVFVTSLSVGHEPLAVGDSVNIRLSRYDEGWVDNMVTRPDSVVFEAEGVRAREQKWPYEFPCDAKDGAGCLFVVPAVDSFTVKWTVFGGGASEGGATVYPVQ